MSELETELDAIAAEAAFSGVVRVESDLGSDEFSGRSVVFGVHAICEAPRVGAEGSEHGTAGRPLRGMENDPEKLQSYYSDLFGWEINADNPMSYGIVSRYPSASAGGELGIGGGIGEAPDGYSGHVTVYVEVPDVEASLAKAESLGGSRMIGPDKVMEGVEIGLVNEGHVIGVVKSEP